MVSDGPHGLRAQPEHGDHVGLSGSLPATCVPTASAVASAWNPDLRDRIGQALAQSARACNLSVILGSGINMKRSPRCGRNVEYFSEDPFLAGELAVGIVHGIQSRGVGTSVKHDAANNLEADRLRVDARVDERALCKIYLPAFERVVMVEQPWTVMCTYNRVNGLCASENPSDLNHLALLITLAKGKVERVTTDPRTATRAVELAQDLRPAVMRLSRRLRQLRDPELDLGSNQLSAMAVLLNSGDQRMGDLAAEERVRPPSMTRIVNGLEERGYVARRPDPRDGRQCVVTLTPAGRTILLDNRQRRDEWLAVRVAELDERDQTTLRAAIAVLARINHD